MTRYGSHQHCVRWILSLNIERTLNEGWLWRNRLTYLLPLDLFTSRCWFTEDGETEAAILPCCDAKACWTADGNAVPGGKATPSAPNTRIVSSPERKVTLSSFPSGFRGVGVVERFNWSSSALRFVTDVFFPRSHDMWIDRRTQRMIVTVRIWYKESLLSSSISVRWQMSVIWTVFRGCCSFNVCNNILGKSGQHWTNNITAYNGHSWIILPRSVPREISPSGQWIDDHKPFGMSNDQEMTL